MKPNNCYLVLAMKEFNQRERAKASPFAARTLRLDELEIGEVEAVCARARELQRGYGLVEESLTEQERRLRG